jgi:hypothetical protein
MTTKNDMDKSIEELLEELDITIDGNFDDAFVNDPLFDDEGEFSNSDFYSLQYI